MGGVSRKELLSKEARILSACAEQLMSRPLDAVTIRSIMEASGLPEWAAYRAIYRVARDRDHLIRRAALEIAAGIGRQIATCPPAVSTVLATLEATIAHMAGMMAGQEFRRFFRLVVAQQPFHPWLQELYEEQIAGAFCRVLEERVRIAGRRSGIAACFHQGAPRQVLRCLEQEICLPSLLPGHEAVAGIEDGIVRNIVKQAFALSYAWDLGAAA